MNKVRVGFIGAGSMANRVHYPSLKEIPEVDLVAVCDIDPKRLKETAERYKIPKRFSDYRKMLSETKLDAAYVVMDPGLIRPIVLDCLSAKLHVFTEKPLGVSSEEAREMAEAARTNGCKSMVGFNRRFSSVLREARRRVEERGPITQCLGEFHKHHLGDTPYYNAPSWIIVDVIHHIDTLRWLGGEVASMKVLARKVDGPHTNNTAVIFDFKGGATGILTANYVSGARVERFEIHGKRIGAYINPPDSARIYSDNSAEPEIIMGANIAGSDAFHRTYGFLAESQHFIRCILEDRRPEADFEFTVRTMELAEAINRGEDKTF
ncbi:MAG: Gfo/Idh/MocA family protein [bacterium]